MSDTTKHRIKITDNITGEVTDGFIELTDSELAELESLGAQLCPDGQSVVEKHRSKN